MPGTGTSPEKRKIRITVTRRRKSSNPPGGRAKKPRRQGVKPYGRQIGHNSRGDGSKFEDYSGYTGSGK